MTYHTYRNIRRLNKIIITLVRYGFGWLVRELRIFPYISFFERFLIFRREGKGLSTPERIRLVLEELGPTFIKLGQVASTRADLLPIDWVEEFKKLQDMVPPFPPGEVRKVVEGSLGAPIDSLFSSFDDVPVASASIAQVHHALLLDGTPVAVKIKRPGIDRTIESDIAVMYTIAHLLERYVPASRRYRPVEVVDEFSRVIHKEQDLTIEGANMNRFHRMFEGDPTVYIPRVYWDFTTTEVLTMERISGTPIDEVDRIKEKGLDIKEIAVTGIKAFFKQVFDYGVFHADLHPGNIFVRDDGVIIYLDFGIVGRIDKNLRKYLARLLFYLVREDYRRMALVHREMGLIGKDVDVEEFEESLREIAEPIYGKELARINISTLLLKLIQTARRYNMRLQPNLLLLQKSMVIIEGVGRQLYPDVNMWEVAKPLVYKWMIKEKLSPRSVAEKTRDYAEEALDMLGDMPVQAHALLGKTLSDELKIGFEHHRLEVISDEIEAMGRRISGGLVAGSLVLGSFVYSAFAPEGAYRVLGIPLASALGFVAAVVLGLRTWAISKER